MECIFLYAYYHINSNVVLELKKRFCVAYFGNKVERLIVHALEGFMNRIWKCVGIISVFSALSVAAQPVEVLLKDARAQAKTLGMSLKGALQTSMKADGPVAALDVCHVKAPKIAEQMSLDGWHVARTSLKVRNPGNTPDEWEVTVMQDFAKRLAEGESPISLEASKTENGEFRYMKAIPTAAVCLVCHGSDIASPVAKKIASLYPQDQATGFNEGELRGAFTLRKQ